MKTSRGFAKKSYNFMPRKPLVTKLKIAGILAGSNSVQTNFKIYFKKFLELLNCKIMQLW